MPTRSHERRAASCRAPATTALLLLLLSAGACQNLEGRLLPENAISGLHLLGQAYDAQQIQTVYADGQDGVHEKPLRIDVREIGSGDKEHVLVMVHGLFSDHRAWRYMAAVLADYYDIWAIDMPGCGSSDAPSAAGLEPEAYSPDWLARMVLSTIRQRSDARSTPPRITLVGHSLGGGVLLRALGSEALRARFADVLGHVDSAVLLAPLDFGLAQPNPNLVQLARLSDLKLWIAKATGILRRTVAEATYRDAMDPDRIPFEEFDRVYRVFLDPRRWHAAQTMLRRALPFDDKAGMDWSRSRMLTRDYRNVDVPCLILWGECDETLPPQSGDSMANDIPHGRMRLVLDCKHCLPIEAPRTCATQILRFLGEDRLAMEAHGDIERREHPQRMMEHMAEAN